VTGTQKSKVVEAHQELTGAVRYIVEPKSRGFDVVDTRAVPRADGVWCYCVDLERAEFHCEAAE
jgi:hypothetical protein